MREGNRHDDDFDNDFDNKKNVSENCNFFWLVVGLIKKYFREQQNINAKQKTKNDDQD